MNEQAIFSEALSKDPAEQNAFLEASCQGDAELRSRVEALLDSHRAAGTFLDTPALEQSGPCEETPAGLDATLATGETPRRDAPLDFLATSQRSDSLGRLGHYEVLQLVGRGGMGMVLRAFDEKLHRVVALKVVARELVASPIGRKRFIREAIAAAQVSHENVVHIHAVEDEGPVPYLVMQFVEGKSLDERLKEEGSIDLKETLRIGFQIASGLAAAHKQGLIHRDIKPANILLENGVQRVKITDFGLARAADDVSVTQTGMIAGTPQYMSPEQAQDQPIDHRSDLFSLGSVMYAMCAGRPPFRGNNTVSVLRKLCDEAPRPLRELNPDVPEWLCQIIDKLLAKKPAERYQSAREVADVLEQRLLELRQSGIQSGTSLRDVKDDAERRATLSAHTTNLKPLAKPRRRLPLATATLLFAAAAAMVAGIIFIQTDHGQFVIETDDPDIAFRVLPAGVRLEDRKANRQYDLKVASRDPKTGKYELEVSDELAGLGFTTKTFTIKRGEKAAVKASFQPRVVAASSGMDGPQVWGEWESLFNGKDLTGWRPNPNWIVVDGALTSLPRAQQSWLWSQRNDFANFQLRVEARIKQGSNSGIFVRYSLPWKRDAYEVNIAADGDPVMTGSLWNLGEAAAVTESLAPPDTWFTMEVLAVNNRITVKVNDKTTVDWTDPENTYRSGALVLQQYTRNSEVQFRKIEIRELRPDPSHGWVQLFNGTDLTGWQTIPGTPPNWSVEDGLLTGRGALQRSSYLYSVQNNYRNFHLRAEARINDPGNSGIHFRATMPDANHQGAPPGYEAQIAGPSADSNRTGSLMVFPSTKYLLVHVADPVPANTWFTQEIIAEGQRIIIKVNGKTLADYQHAGPTEGYLALQAFQGSTIVQFRKIEIRELQASTESKSAAVDLATWGTFVDPSAACSIIREPQRLTIKVPGDRPYNMVPIQGYNPDAPRLLRQVEGDFLLQVTVPPYAKPVANTSSRPGGKISFRAAGLLVWADSTSFLRLERASYGEQQEGAPYLNAEWYIGGQFRSDNTARALSAGPTYLQIERRGGVLYLRQSDDGRSWNDYRTVTEFAVSKKLTVGLVASNSTNSEFTAAFENLTLRTSASSGLAVQKPATIESLTGPVDLRTYRGQIGKILYVQTVGRKTGSIWGTNPYTDDSDLATAGVHAGILTDGQSGMVKVTILDGQANYYQVTRNGITSHNYVSYGGSFRVEAVPPVGQSTDAPHPAVAPFDAQQAKQYQEAWAKHLGVPVEMTNSIGMKLRLIPPGEFMMGSPPDEVAELLMRDDAEWLRSRYREETQIPISAKLPFYLGTYEVTVGEFRAFVEATTYRTTAEADGRGGRAYQDGKIQQRPEWIWNHPDFARSDRQPVVCVSYQDALVFCRWLSDKEGRTYQLAGEEVWEYACRAGTTTRWHSGDDPERLQDVAWFGEPAGSVAHEVGQKLPNAFGLFDMHGNVLEWTASRAEGGYLRARGGSYATPAIQVRSAFRDRRLETHADSSTGFRVAISGDLQSPAPNIATTGERKLQGTWKSTSVTALQLEITFAGDQCTLKRVPKGESPDPAAVKTEISSTFHVDASAQPLRIMVIDPKDESKRLLGIYRLEGDTLFFCFRLEPKDGDYPTQFATNPQTGSELAILKRLAPRD